MAFKKLLKNLFGGGGGNALAEVEEARERAEKALEDLRRLAQEVGASPPALAAVPGVLEDTREAEREETAGPVSLVEKYDAAWKSVIEARSELLRANPERMASEYLEEMGRCAEDIEAPTARTFAFLQLAGLQAAVKNEEDSAHFLGRALAAIDDGAHVATVMNGLASLRPLKERIGEEWFQARFDDVVESVGSFGDPSEEVTAHCEIVRGRSAFGDFEGALSHARGIEDPWYQEQAVAIVLEAKAMAGDAAGARELVEELEDPALAGAAWKSIVHAEARAGDLAGARDVARAIEDPDWRSAALREVAEQQARSGEIEAAVELAEGIEAAQWRADALRGIAEVHAEEGDVDAAFALIARIEVPVFQQQAVVEVVQALVKRGDSAGAKGAAQRIPDGATRAMALGSIAREEARQGRIEESRATLELVREAAGTAVVGASFDSVLAMIAEVQAWHGDLADAVHTAEGILQPQARAQLLHDLAADLVKDGNLARLAELEALYEEPLGRTWLLLGATRYGVAHLAALER